MWPPPSGLGRPGLDVELPREPPLCCCQIVGVAHASASRQPAPRRPSTFAPNFTPPSPTSRRKGSGVSRSFALNLKGIRVAPLQMPHIFGYESPDPKPDESDTGDDPPTATRTVGSRTEVW